MKHVRLFMLALGCLVFATSCEKSYTCSCKFNGQPSRDFDITLPAMRHNDATVTCNDYSLHMDSVAYATCTLK